MKNKLLIAGSHGGTTALSLIEEIHLRSFKWNIIFLGNKWATEDKKELSFEFKYLPKEGVRFLNVESGKVENKFTRYSITAFLKIPFGFLQVFWNILKYKPDVVFSLGGSTGAMAAFWGWLLRKPVVLHEPTATAGRANLLSKSFASKIVVSRVTSKKYYKGKNVILTGNPISGYLSKLATSNNEGSVRNILVMGGSRGSKLINDALYPLLKELTEKFKVIHQYGNRDYKRFEKMNLKNYIGFGSIEHNSMLKLINDADIVVSRAGANSVSEIIALKKPSIFVPIPWSYLDEQTENANYAVNTGMARIIPQSALTPKRLYNEIFDMKNNYKKILEMAKALNSPDLQASRKIVDILESYMSQ